MADISLYFHIPYCSQKCPYCDFYSGGARIADWPRLIKAFLTELSQRKSEWEGERVVSIYFGGGTPSLLPDEYLYYLINETISLLGTSNIAEDCEITLEANPEDVNNDAADLWKKSGVNRVSLGVQTFDDGLLSSIRRRHRGEDAENAIKILKRHFDNVNADLIFGLPQQTVKQLDTDLSKLISLKPQHVSIYSLMYEEGTALTELRNLGKVKAVNEDTVSEMFMNIIDSLERAGYERYETSNYSMPGKESRHNMGYWTGRKYIGIGPSAHSYDGEESRSWNPADIRGYLDHYAPLTDRSSSAYQHNHHIESQGKHNYSPENEHLSSLQLMEENIMLGMRMKRGLDLEGYGKKFGLKELQGLINRARKYINEGDIMVAPDNYLIITDKAVLRQDSIIVDLLP